MGVFCLVIYSNFVTEIVPLFKVLSFIKLYEAESVFV